MYAGAPTVQSVEFNVADGDFTVLPSNARLQTGTPPLRTPNYFVSVGQFLNALTVYKFHVDWHSISLSTFTGPDVPLAATSWPNAAVANAPTTGHGTTPGYFGDPGNDAESICEYWRRRVTMEYAYSSQGQHDRLCRAAAGIKSRLPAELWRRLFPRQRPGTRMQQM